MYLKELSIQGFKSFDEKQTISFRNNHCGLYYLTGKNTVTPSLGANGAGKTSILDALCWVLFEKTSKGVKAKNVKNYKGAKPVKVTVKFTSRFDNEIVLSRTWKPNSLKWSKNGGDFETAKQEELEEELGLSYKTFHYSIVIPQFASLLFDLTPGEQALLLSEIFELDEWDEYTKNASSAVGFYDGLLYDITRDMDTSKGQLLTYQDMEWDEKIAEWEKERETAIQQYSRQLDSAVKQVEKHKDALNSFTHTDFSEQLADVNSIIDEYAKELKEIQKDDRIARSEYASIKKEIELLDKEVRRFDQLGEVCPTCEQKVDEDHLSSRLHEIQVKKEKLKENLKEYELDFKDIEEDRQEAEDELRAARKEKEEIQAKQNKQQSEEDVIKTNIRHEERNLRTIKINLEHKKLVQNPYSVEKDENEQKIKMLEESLVKAEEDYKETSDKRGMVEYWKNNFKAVKLFIIGEVLAQLEVEINTNLQTMGLDDWEIQLNIARETSTNTLKKEMNVLIKSPHTDDLVPWNSWSGGEKQRLRIASATALASIILDRKGINSNIEFWDEPSYGVNEAGIVPLLNTFKDHAISTGKQIWLIDHTIAEKSHFERTITVTKTDNGSKIEE